MAHPASESHGAAPRRRASAIPVFHAAPVTRAPATHAPATHSSGSSSSSSRSSGGGGGGGSRRSGGGGGGGGKAKDPYAYAKAAQKKADKKANQRALDSAAAMGQQIAALRVALGKKGFIHELNTKLANVKLLQGQADTNLTKGYKERYGSLGDTASDNEKALAGQTYTNQANRSRERTNALSEATAQGAGESDQLRTQAMSLRNWNANQNEQNRTFFDTLTSTNSSLHDLTTDTRTARVNNVIEYNADRDQLWTKYYDDRSETLTNLGNALGQQADYFRQANEAVPGKSRGKAKHASAASAGAFRRASLASGKAWKNPGVPANIRNWKGEADFEGEVNNSVFAAAATEIGPKDKPEGASLRKWEK